MTASCSKWAGKSRTIGEAALYCGDSLELLQAGVFGKIGTIVSGTPYGIGSSSRCWNLHKTAIAVNDAVSLRSWK